ncbi:DUF1461 domain-containing protein [Thiofaba sp. EF100]|uniref:DUF1461 domain-containing protein n=1 Tax=Thiofaba sp. EF100 TaxID=3121274 RepID=UPI0032214F19
MPRAVRGLAIAAYGLLLWLAALWLAWLLLAKVDFLYPMAYRLIDIPATLNTFVPQNRHGRQDFIRTDAAEHARLFAAIAEAVRHGGQGLEGLRYHDPQGRELGRLLTADEVTHLRDVAHLIETGERAGLLALAGWGGLALLLSLGRVPVPQAGRLLAGSLAGLALLAGALLALGPVEVFYAWHRWVFPPDHPWFFYYQDSLMSSLMQAPNLFGFIGALWLGASLMLLLALNVMARQAGRILMQRRSS